VGASDSSLHILAGGVIALHARLRWAPEWTVISEESFLSDDFSMAQYSNFINEYTNLSIFST